MCEESGRIGTASGRDGYRCFAIFLLVTGLTLAQPVSAATIDFESFNDGDVLSNQLAGVTFTDLAILTSGSSLNEFEFPPRSGVNVATGTASSSSIAFSNALSSFGGYFIYLGGLTIDFYHGATLLGSVSSAFADNFVSSGHAPNEFLQFVATGGSAITSIVLTGTFTLDDMSYVASTNQPPVPEPASILLFLTGGVALVYRHRGRFSRRV